MIAEPSRPTIRPWVNSLIVTLIVLVFLAGFARMFTISFRGNDDTVWLYLSGIELGYAGATAPLHDAVRAYLPGQPNGERALKRWNLRAAYSQNYLAPSAFIYAASRTIKGFVRGLRGDYALFVALSIAIGVIMSTIVAVSVLRWAILSCEDSATSYGALLGLAVIAGLSMLPVGIGSLRNPFDTGGVGESIRYLTQLFLVGGSEYSIFGYTPRSQFYLSALAVFLLRWRSRWLAAYVLTLLLALLHQSMAGLLLVVLVATDLLLRPQLFDRRTIAVVVIGVAALFARESLFGQLGLWPLIAIVGVAAAVVIGAGLATRAGRQVPLWHSVENRLLAPLRRRLERLGPIGGDLAVIFGAWLLTLPIAAIVSRVAEAQAAYSFWAEIHVRVLMLLQPAILVGLAILAVRWLQDNLIIDRRWLYGTIIGLSALITVPVVAGALARYEAPLERIGQALYRYNSLFGQPLPRLDIETREAALYYAIAFEIDTARDTVRPMLAGR